MSRGRAYTRRDSPPALRVDAAGKGHAQWPEPFGWL